jgi:competence protein ComEC
LIASVAVAPFAAFHFHQSQQYAVLANLIAIPVCNFLVMPAALATLVLMPLGLEALALWPMGWGIEAMSWCASLVSALPGAVGHVPAIPTLAFALIVLGGLWLALWQTPLRLAGIALALAGLAIAPLLPRPDLLVARNGALVAVRGADGLLSALPARQAKFELERWLEYDGDARAAEEVERAQGFTCDGIGCVTEVKGLVLSVARSPAAIFEDCAMARILVLAVPRPKGCDGPDAVIDYFDVWREGAHAVYIDNRDGAGEARITIDTVAAHRGARPWAHVIARPAAFAKTPDADSSDGAGRSRQTFNPQSNTGSAVVPPATDLALPPRAEIEDDDGETDVFDALPGLEGYPAAQEPANPASAAD